MIDEIKSQSDFSLAVENGVANITFTRPEKANAFNPRMIPLLRRIFTELRFDSKLRVVVIRGQGKHFMAGGDLEGVHKLESLTAAERAALGENPIEAYNGMIAAMLRLNAPVVASVQGGVAGAAVGLIGACDLVIATETAFFWAAHVLHGGSNDGLLSYFLPRHVGLRKALEMALLGDRILAADAKSLGLVNIVVPDAQLTPETDKLVARLSKGPTAGYGKIKRLMYASFGNSMAEQGELEVRSYGEALNTEDVSEGLNGFFDKRPPVFKGR